MPFNNPVQFEQGQRITWVHQPITIDHNGIRCSIKPDGKVLLSRSAGADPENPGEVLIDEIEVPASLIFKVARLLKDTRTAEISK